MALDRAVVQDSLFARGISSMVSVSELLQNTA